jgi:SAM-dependent methyltransferase
MIEEITSFGEFVADPLREASCRARLTEYLTRIGQRPVDKNVDELFSLESGMRSRFEYFVPKMGQSSLRRLLVSGCAVATEMIIARSYGFQEIFGTEIAEEYVDIGRQRLEGQLGFHVRLYDGLHLPFDSDTFTAVVSGHIIEHTPSPIEYLKEHIRVLAPGGFLFLEFPNRYHHTELHTGLPSVEYLPGPMRSLALRYLASPFSICSKDHRRLYDDIRRTLQPVSVWQIQRFLRSFDLGESRVIHHYAPAPGYTRLVIAKTART